jgi:serine/threonine-protein kinase
MLCVSIANGEREDIWTVEVKTGKLSRVTSGDRNYTACMWSPDGLFLVLAARHEGVFWQRLDSRSGNPRPLIASKNIQMPWSFTPDGKHLAYYELNSETGFDIWTVPIEIMNLELHAGKPEVFVHTKGFEVYPAFSPDGKWLAYGSNESGTWQIYVRGFPDNGRATEVSVNGGRIPAWSPNSHELLFRTDEQRIMAASYRVDGVSFIAQEPRLWSPAQLADTGVVSNFELSRDGRLVLGLMPTFGPDGVQATNHVTFFLNFFEELQRRSPQTPK